MKSIKILHANDDNYNLGGAFIITYRVERYLKNYGYSYDYITMDHFIEKSEKYPIDDNDKTYSANLRNNKFLGHILLPFYVNNILKKTNYHVIHIDTDSAWKALLYAIPAKKNKLKVLVHSHAMGIEGSAKWLKKICEILAKKILVMYTDKFIACSHAAAEWIVPAKCKKSVSIVFNGIDLNSFYFDIEARRQYRKKLKLDKCIVIGNVGVFSENKNQKYLIELLPELLKQDSSIRLLLVGDNENYYGEEILKLVKENELQDKVIFTGVRDDIRQLMSCMDIYIHTAKMEGFGLVSMEAQATGLPTYISDSLPSDSLVTEWGYAFSLDSGKNDIKRALECLCIDEQARMNRHMDNKYSLEYMAELEAQIYNELLST